MNNIQIAVNAGSYLCFRYQSMIAGANSINLRLKVLDLNNNIKDVLFSIPITATVGLIPTEVVFPLSCNFIISVLALNDTALNPLFYGSFWCELFLCYDSLAVSKYHCLFSGFLSTTSSLFYPNNILGSLNSDTGFYALDIIPNPAVGNDFTFTSNAFIYFELVYLLISIITDATVINRTIRLILEAPVGSASYFISTVLIPASTTLNFVFRPNDQVATLFGITYNEGIHQPLLNSGSVRVTSNILNLQAGDQLLGIVVFYNHKFII